MSAGDFKELLRKNGVDATHVELLIGPFKIGLDVTVRSAISPDTILKAKSNEFKLVYIRPAGVEMLARFYLTEDWIGSHRISSVSEKQVLENLFC